MKLTSIAGLVVLSLTSTLVSCIPLGGLTDNEGNSVLLERGEFNGDEVTHLSRDFLSESESDMFARDPEPYVEQYPDLTHVSLGVRAAEKRGAPAFKPPTPGRGPGGFSGFDAGNSLGNLIIGIQNEPGLRGDFVKSLIDATTKAKPGFQAIVCHPKHSYKFEGTQGKDWDHSHAEYQKEATPGTVGFEVYWFKKGWFQNEGDGGWENWSYTGSPKKEGNQGHKLTYT